MKYKHHYLPILSCIFIVGLLIASCGCIEPTNNQNEMLDHYDLIVDDDFNKNTPGWGKNAFKNIQDAINVSLVNSSIFVFNGEYHEKLMINNSVTIVGEDANNTIINGNKARHVILIEGHFVNISGFTIMNSSVPTGNGMFINTDKNTISNNIFTKNSHGILMQHAIDNRIQGNKFYNISEYGMYLISNSDYNDISHNIYVDNYNGLRIKGSRRNNVTYNIFIDNKAKNIYLCCGAVNNFVFSNILSNDTYSDNYDNYWDNRFNSGNYWEAYHLESQGAYDNDSNGIIDTPYSLTQIRHNDNFPLTEPVIVVNPFITNEYERIQK
jgi:parallel beta-helix repeat protein